MTTGYGDLFFHIPLSHPAQPKYHEIIESCFCSVVLQCSVLLLLVLVLYGGNEIQKI